jgi:DNA-binding response OmpR family regulator
VPFYLHDTMDLVLWIGRRSAPPDLGPLLRAEGLEFRAYADAEEAVAGTRAERVAAAIVAWDGPGCADIERFSASHPEAQVLSASDVAVPRGLVLALSAGASGILEFKSQTRAEILGQIRDWVSRHHKLARERDLLFRLRALNEDFLKQVVAAQKRSLELEEQLQPDERGDREETPQVLVVDDEEAVRGVLQMLLSRRGHQHQVVQTGEAAVDAISAQRFDLVITDKNLPGMSGLDVLREVKRRSPDTAVILMTGYASMDSAIDALNEGAAAYLEKPFDHVRIVAEKIESVLEKRREHLRHRRYLFTIKERNRSFLDQYRAVRADLEAWLDTLGAGAPEDPRARRAEAG